MTDRRDFIKTTAAAATLLSISSIPSVFSKEGFDVHKYHLHKGQSW